MANRIKGITVEIGGDTTKLSKALEGVNKNIKNTQTQLKDVQKLLKLDPTNTELLSQKHKLLADAVKAAKENLYQIPTYRMKREEVKTVIFRYVFGYYNTQRINSFNEGGIPPVELRSSKQLTHHAA